MTGAPQRPGLHVAISVAASATIAAYGVALLQQVLYARRLGVGPDTDALAAALGWAIATSGFVGTTLSSVLVPRYVRLASRDPAAGISTFRAGATLGLAAGAIATVGSFALSESLAAVLLPGSATQVQRHLAELLRVTAPLHVLWTAVWLGLALANSIERYAFAALSPVVATLPVIATLLASHDPSVDVVAGAYVAGVTVQSAVLIGGLWTRARALIPTGAVSRLRGLAGPILWIGLGFSLYAAANVILRMVASAGLPGEVAAVDYGLRLALAAEQVLLSGVLAVMLTRWSQSSASGEFGSHEAARGASIAMGAIVGFAAVFGLLAPEIVETLFASASFGPRSVELVSSFMRWMVPGLIAHMVLMVVLRGLLARHATRSVSASASATVLTTAAVGWVMASQGVVGVGLAYSAGWIAGAIIAVIALVPRLNDLARLAGEALRSLMAALVAVAAAGLVLTVLDGGLIRMLVGGLIAGAAFVVAGLALRVGFATEIRRIALNGRFAS